MKRCLLCLSILFLFETNIFANTLSDIQNKGVLRVGVWEGQPPFSQLSDGIFSGFEVDFANEIAKNIFNDKNGKIEFVGLEVTDRENFLINNKVDLVIATFTITDERAKKVDFSLPYFSTNQGVLTKKEDNIQKMSDLKGKKIIVENGALGQQFFKSKGFETITCHNSNDCYKMLKNGNGDAYANDNVIVLAYPVIDRNVEVNIKTLGQADFFGIGVAKGNKELLEFINNTLIKLSKDGFFKKAFKNTIDPFYKGTAEEKYFLLDDIYKIFG